MRDSDTIARMGGDEFSVIMPDIAATEDPLQIAETLLACLTEPFMLPQGAAQISGSMGIALYPQHAEGVENLMQCADVAMYAAKRAGKNQVQVWMSDDGPSPSWQPPVIGIGPAA
jgi:diguanylate cyclase (GGDEF)-like protein